MSIKSVLEENLVKLDLEGNSKEEIIHELLDLLAKAGKVKDTETAFRDIMSRENKMSTGIQDGVAIPHAKTKAVESLVACVGVKKEGVDFASLDGKLSNIFIMTLSSPNRIGPHVQFLAEISNIIIKKEARDKILSAKTPGEILEVFGL
ncbi:MAG: PTS sugar transporter subunit IIA [Sphaerochaetaceae bacterium]